VTASVSLIKIEIDSFTSLYFVFFLRQQLEFLAPFVEQNSRHRIEQTKYHRLGQTLHVEVRKVAARIPLRRPGRISLSFSRCRATRHKVRLQITALFKEGMQARVPALPGVNPRTVLQFSGPQSGHPLQSRNYQEIPSELDLQWCGG